MKKSFEILKKTRKSLLGLINDLTLEQLNAIPPGFNNNIAWNLGHMVASQQGLCYIRAGLPMFVTEKFFEAYKPGTRPPNTVDINEWEIIKDLFLTSIAAFETDHQNDLFKNYTPWTNRFGIDLTNIDETIDYLIHHEGFHFGYIMALKRTVQT